MQTINRDPMFPNTKSSRRNQKDEHRHLEPVTPNISPKSFPCTCLVPTRICTALLGDNSWDLQLENTSCLFYIHRSAAVPFTTTPFHHRSTTAPPPFHHRAITVPPSFHEVYHGISQWDIQWMFNGISHGISTGISKGRSHGLTSKL